jgi:RNA polymerase sigma factor (sigma-70 family)
MRRVVLSEWSKPVSLSRQERISWMALGISSRRSRPVESPSGGSGSIAVGSDSRPERPSVARFPTTHWSQVVAAGDRAAPEARDALAELCRAYWYPLYAFIRRKGHGPEDAQDLVQGFLASLLERDDLRTLEPARGRFRSFLMASCAHYLSKQRDRARALKRGGGRTPISIDRLEAESRFGVEPSHDLTPERLFERRWALTLLGHVLDRLDLEMDRPDRKPLYDQLRPALVGLDEIPSYRQIGESLGLSEGAVKMAAHRLRARFRELLRDEISRTVSEPSEVDAEIGTLLAALAL